MGTFQLENESKDRDRDKERIAGNNLDRDEVLGVEEVRGSFDKERTECIIALKVYDHCRQPECKLLHTA